MNVNDNVYVIPFDKLDERYKEESDRLGISESVWRELEGKRGIVAKVDEINNITLVAFPTIEECEGSTNPIMLYFYEDTLEKVLFGTEEE